MIGALIGRFRAAHSNHQRIASGAVLIGVLVLVAKLFVAAREMAIAWRYGISGIVDAYQLAFTVTTWLPVMLTGVMTVVLVPRLVALRRQGTDRRLFVAELNGAVALVGLAVAALTWLVGPAAAAWLAADLDPRIVRLTAAMSAQMAPIALFIVMAGYLSARLQARERYAYSVTEALPALLIALLVLGPWKIGEAAPLIWGTVFGYLLQLLVVATMVRRGDAPIGRVRLRHRSPEWRTLYQAIFVMVGGQVVLSLTIPLDQAFAARLGEGAVATFGYANRIVTLITGFGTIVLARALLPVFSGAVAAGDLVLGARQARQWSILFLVLGVLVAIAGWLVAPWAVAILFERGAFSADDSDVVAHVLRFGLLQMPAYFGAIVLVQWYFAQGRYRQILGITVCAVAVKLALNILLVGSFGLGGIFIATAAMYSLIYVFMELAARMWTSDRSSELGQAPTNSEER